VRGVVVLPPDEANGELGVAVPIKRVSGRSHARLRMTALLAGVSLSAVSAHATDGTWVGGGPPFPTEWTQGNNWNSAAVPDNTARFTNNAAPTSVDISIPATIRTIQFTSSAPAYFFQNFISLSVNGTGVVNNSSSLPSFLNFGDLTFNNASTAGNATINNNFGFVFFNDTSSAGNAAISNAGSITFANSTIGVR
jgi:hypothetical protein